MKRKNIQLNYNSAFEMLQLKSELSNQDLEKRILDFAMIHKILYDDISECGKTLGFYIKESDLTLTQFCVACFGKSTQDIEMYVDALLIFGFGDCPDCGCETEDLGDSHECRNCGYHVTFFDPDIYRDDN